MSDLNVLDSSAILAFLAGEPGAHEVHKAIRQAPSWVSSINMCEVLGKLLDAGMTPDAAQEAFAALRLSVVPFDGELAFQAALLKARTKSIGASLGDRACLALAFQMHAQGENPTILTTDRAWTKLSWPFKIQLIR